MDGLFDRLQNEIKVQNEQNGLSPIDLLDMPQGMATVVHKLIRNNGSRLEDIAAEMDQSPAEVKKILDDLEAKGYVRSVKVKNQTWFKANFGRKTDRPQSSSLWSMLDDLTE